MRSARVVVAEDDTPIRELVVHHLERDGFHCDQAADGPTALRLSRAGAGVLVLDIGLPAIDGFEIVRTLRREGHAIPILILTARSDEIDRILGLEIGADDVVTKPFSPREVLARVKALGRRVGLTPSNARVALHFGRIVIDEGARVVTVDGVDVGLKPREFSLLLELASNPNIALSRATLLERVWGFDFDGDERTIDVHVRRLRLRLEEKTQHPVVLHTVHGFGYKFCPLRTEP
jgi:two-component system alkaline phosphatase synthesis response regulator PhoP